MDDESPWARFLTEQDRAVLELWGFGARMGFAQRPALLIIDVSVSFCGEFPEPIDQAARRYPTSCGQAAWDALPKIERLIRAARRRSVPVIYTTGRFRDDGWDYGAWRWKQTGGAIGDQALPANADPHAIMPQIAPEKHDLVLFKQKPSAFFGVNLVGYLNLLGCDGLILAGCTTSGCIRATAVDASSYNYRVAVAADACFDRIAISHAVSLLDMQLKYADVTATDEIIAHLDSLAGERSEVRSARLPGRE